MGQRILVAALVIVCVVAVLTIVGLRAWSEQAHERFRDEVLLVLAQRFHHAAEAVPGNPDVVDIGGKRRDLRALFEIAAALPELERGEAIYKSLLGDTATVGRPVVREEPFEGDGAKAAPPAFATIGSPKRVEVLRVAPDGSRIR